MSIPYTGSSSSTVLSTSPTLSSRCALSSFDGQEDGSAVDSPASSSSSREPSLDASADGMDVEFANPSEPAMPSEESFPRRTLRKRVTTSKGSSLRFKPASVSAITPRQGTSPEDNLTRKAYKQAYLQSAARAQNDREDRVRELKKRALAIPSTGKTPATWRQRLVMQMVYDEITPYPDEAWVSQLGVIINREYHQVKNWFSNQRQKDARDSRQHTPQPATPTGLEASLCKIPCDGRDLRLRTVALESCKAEYWSDTFFDEVVMIYNFRLLAKHSQEEARAACGEPVPDVGIPS
ncbi:hypothetical protein M405DRAFT_838260 [Rhizopogon salebrosus TDB-379]|nr:hypothetical protein M405DRAFT_838260 [Rhizopogon salebrosus TDB-379]